LIFKYFQATQTGIILYNYIASEWLLLHENVLFLNSVTR